MSLKEALMRWTALFCASPMSGVGACAASTAASQPAPSSVVEGGISAAGGAAPVGSSAVDGKTASCGSVRPWGALGTGAAPIGFEGGDLLATVVPGSPSGEEP